MKKSLLTVIMGLIMIAFASCGGSNNGHSKAFNEAKKVYDGIQESINKATTCDDVDMAAFGVLGLLGIDGLDKLDEAENKELEELGENSPRPWKRRKPLWTAKTMTLGCSMTTKFPLTKNPLKLNNL